MHLIACTLAAPGGASAIVLVEATERIVRWREQDDQAAAERSLYAPGRFELRAGQVKAIELTYAVRGIETTRRTVSRVGDRLRELSGTLKGDSHIIADVGGAGVEARRTLRQKRLPVTAVLVTQGDHEVWADDGTRLLPRRSLTELVSQLLERDAVRIAEQVPHRAQLQSELVAGDGPVGTAAALALWMGEYQRPTHPDEWEVFRR